MNDREPLPRCVGCGEPTTSRTDDGRPKHVGCPDHPSDREPILTPEYLAEIGAAFADEPIEVRRIVTSDHKLMLVVGPFSGPPAANPPDPTGDARSPADPSPEREDWFDSLPTKHGPAFDHPAADTIPKPLDLNGDALTCPTCARPWDGTEPSPEPLNGSESVSPNGGDVLRSDGPVVDEPAATDSDPLERARALIETIHVASGDLATLYGPLWHARRAALTAAAPTAGAGGLADAIKADLTALAHWSREDWEERGRGGDPIARTINAARDIVDAHLALAPVAHREETE